MVRGARCTLQVAWCVVHGACCRSRRRRTSSVDSDADSVRVRPTEKRRSPHSCKSAPPPPPQLSCWKRTSESSGSERLSGASYGRARGTACGDGAYGRSVSCMLQHVAGCIHAATCCGLQSGISHSTCLLGLSRIRCSAVAMAHGVRCPLRAKLLGACGALSAHVARCVLQSARRMLQSARRMLQSAAQVACCTSERRSSGIHSTVT